MSTRGAKEWEKHCNFVIRYENCLVPPNNNPVRVVFFGALGYFKGIRILETTAHMNMHNKGFFEFHFFGDKEQSFEPEKYGITYHGKYDRSELPTLLKEIAPSFSIIPSIGPETFCHALTESWAAGIPVFASDIGALRERIKRHGGGWLLNQNEPYSWYKKMLQIAENPIEYKQRMEEIKSMHFKSVREMTDEYCKIYADCLSLRKPTPTV